MLGLLVRVCYTKYSQGGDTYVTTNKKAYSFTPQNEKATSKTQTALARHRDYTSYV